MNTQTLEVIPVEEKINSELVKENITEKILSELETKYDALTINGQEDKKGFEAVVAARKECKKMMALITTICEKGREPALEEQREWIATEKKHKERVGKLKDYLEKQEKEYEAKEKEIAAENKRKHDAQFVERSTELTKYGANLIDGYFVLGDIKFEASSIREVDAEIWEENIKPKYKVIFDEAEKIRVENEQKLARVEQMRTTIFKSRFDILLDVEAVSGMILNRHTDLKVIDKEELINLSDKDFTSLAINHNLEVNNFLLDQKKEKELKERTERRTKELYSLGFTFDGTDFIHNTVTMFVSAVNDVDDEKYAKLLDIATRQIEVIKEEAKGKQEESRKKVQEDAEKFALGTVRRSILADYEETNYTDISLGEMEESKWTGILGEARNKFNDKKQVELNAKHLKEKQDAELKAQEELAKAGDKANWSHFINLLKSVKVPAMKSGKYRDFASIATEKIEEIINLNAKA